MKLINSILEKDNLIIGCAALYPLQDAAAGELACVAVTKEYQRGSRARNLLSHVEKQAESLQLEEIYVLTTRTDHWFLEQGFIETTVDALPAKRKELYNYQRNSKVLVKKLQSTNILS